MLVLSASDTQFIRIGENIRITAWRNGREIRIGIQAPKEIPVVREPLGVCPFAKALQNTIWMDRDLGVNQ